MSENGTQDQESNITNMWGLQISAVVDGKVVNIEELEDQIFAQKMIGDGYGIYPTSQTVYAPCDCKVEQISPTKHAVYLSIAENLKLLIHIGIDTIELKGEGFESTIETGMVIEKGQPLITFDQKLIEAEGLNPVIAVIVLNGSGQELTLDVFPTDNAKAKETIAMAINKS